MLIKHLSEPSGTEIPNESHVNITLIFHQRSKLRVLAFFFDDMDHIQRELTAAVFIQ